MLLWVLWKAQFGQIEQVGLSLLQIFFFERILFSGCWRYNHNALLPCEYSLFHPFTSLHKVTLSASGHYCNSIAISMVHKCYKTLLLWVPLVVEQSRGALEGLGAKVAAVWSLIVVAPLVVGQPGRPSEALPTVHTLEGMVRLVGLLCWAWHRRRHHVQNHLFTTLYYCLVSILQLPSVPIILTILSWTKKGRERREGGSGLRW